MSQPVARPNGVDIQGIIAPSEDANRSIRYLTKYLTKSVAETYTDLHHADGAYKAHIDRLHAEVLYLPRSETCANWLRYGVQPKDADPGRVPGMCPSKAHDRENLGLGGRRVQVSRAWSGKTLSEHSAGVSTSIGTPIEPDNPSRSWYTVRKVLGEPAPRFHDVPT